MPEKPDEYLQGGIWTLLGRQEPEPIGKEEGLRWGLLHLGYVKRELLKLEERALARGDRDLLHGIVDSRLRALDVERELRSNLGLDC